MESLNETPPPDRVPDAAGSAQTRAGMSSGSDRPDHALASTATASDPPDGDGEPGAADRGRDGQGNVGDALRSIYQQTIEENVPDEMLDLLGRLD